MKKKVGILTYHAAHNYGSMLQAFALQTYLERKGHVVRVINLRKPIQRKVYAKTLDLWHPKSFLLRLLLNPKQSIQAQQKWNRFEAFLSQMLHITKECTDHKGVEKIICEENFQVLIVGSDQIWNTACLDFDESFLLPFHGKFKKVAYAPSMGPSPQFKSNKYKELFALNLPNFNAVSTRESQSSSFLQNELNVKVETVVDPVLLLDGSEYSSLYGDKPLIKGEYIFYYSPLDKKEYFEKAQQLSALTGLPIIVTQIHDYYKSGGAKSYYACGPKEFLNILKYSKYVIGCSFHLLAFSLLFHKDFYSIEGANDDRMSNLLDFCQLQNRSILAHENIKCLEGKIDYNLVELKLKEMRKKSQSYLSII